jgi:hypothetical protein
MDGEQLSLDLFPPPSFDSLLMQQRFDGIRVTISRRLKRGWYLKFHRIDKTTVLTIPHYLESAPQEIKEALLQWVLCACGRGKDRRKKKREIEHRIWNYIESIQAAPSRSRAVDPGEYAKKAHGTVYDLQEIFDSINNRFFGGRIEGYVRWGGYATTTSYQSRKKDSNGNPCDLITIAGAYDHPSVPRYAIEAVMYHEMLHIAIPPRRIQGRRTIHGKEFTRAERQFPAYTQWRQWERKHLRKLAGALKRKRTLLQRRKK